MSTPPGDEQGGQDQGGWGTPPPPPGQPPGQDQGWGQPQQSWGQPEQQPGWQQPGEQWGSPPYGGTPGAPQQTNGLAIGALVASVLGFFCGVGFIIGLILGYMARNQIRSSGGQQGGGGLATAAIVIGWIGVALTVLGILFVAVVFTGAFPAAF